MKMANHMPRNSLVKQQKSRSGKQRQQDEIRGVMMTDSRELKCCVSTRLQR